MLFPFYDQKFYAIYPFGSFTYPQIQHQSYDFPSQAPENLIPQENVIPQAENALESHDFSKETFCRELRKQLTKLHEETVDHTKVHWTTQENLLLRKLVQVDKMGWKAIPRFFEGRTQNMCYSRYRRISNGSKEQSWTEDEERELIRLVDLYGEKWKKISQEMPRFTAKQIRERYLNCLRPNIIREVFTLEEDFKICQFILEKGKSWRKLELVLPGRTEGAIKNRFNGRLSPIMQNLLGIKYENEE